MSRNDAWMPLYGDRLLTSDTWLLAKPAARAVMLPLWWAAWKAEPVGSLLDNDGVLAQLAGLGSDVRAWRAVRDAALRGWQVGPDGRLYHPVVVELAAEALRITAKKTAEREQDRERLREWREKRKEKPERNAVETRFTGVSETGVKPVDNRTGQNSSSEANASGAKAPPPRSAKDALWQDGIPILINLTGKTRSQCGSLLGRLLSNMHDDCPALTKALREAEEQRPVNPEAWLMARTGGKRGAPAAKEGRGDWMHSHLFGDRGQGAEIDGEMA